MGYQKHKNFMLRWLTKELTPQSHRIRKSIKKPDDNKTVHKKHSQSNKILRFRKSERHLHWAIAIPFMICYTTALILVFIYNPNPLRAHREIFSLIHRVSGVCLVILPLLAIIKSRKDIRMYYYNIKQAWVWTFEDVKWLVMMGLASISKRFKLPEQGKFNAAEKINFMMLMATYPLYVVTGMFIWLTNGALLSWIIHFGMALVATPLLIGHKFMATINPDTRIGLSGMINGYVDRHWAKHHYTKWYREHFEESPTPHHPQPQHAMTDDNLVPVPVETHAKTPQPVEAA
jgi:formate dehydrogenase subunit gamma